MEPVIEALDGSFTNRVKSLQQLAVEHGIEASLDIVRRGFARFGYKRGVPYTSPFLSDRSKQPRLEWASKPHHTSLEYWKHAIWSDESSFSTQAFRRQHLTKCRGERYNPEAIQHTYQSGRSHSWFGAPMDGISSSSLIFLEPEPGSRGVTSKAYVRQVLTGYLAMPIHYAVW